MAPRRIALVLCVLVAAAAALAVPVLAHSGAGGSAVETRFTFPPWMVWVAGAGVVAVSFAIVGGFLSREDPHGHGAVAGPPPSEKGSRPRAGLTWGRGIVLAVLALVAANAFLPGSDSVLPQTVVWLGLWSLLPILSYGLGDVWPRISPFEALRPLAAQARGERAPQAYPGWLGAWPATLLLLGVIGLEVSAHPWAESASPLAVLVLAYVLLTLVGMTLYGEVWLREAEVFTRSFRWWAAAAPFHFESGRLRFRGASGGLQHLPVRSPADVAFTIALLYGVNFDAFLATRFGASALEHYRDFGVPLAHAALLLTGFVCFLGVWLLAARAIRDKAEAHKQVRVVAARFAASLIPIAVGYHLAHNLFMVLENAPRFVLAALDPLGLGGWPEGWVDLPLRIAFTDPLIALLGALQVLFILTGHVLAVIAAHRLAFDTFPSRIQAVRSEVPLTLVMVAYTWTGLWLLSGGHGGGMA